MHTLSQILDLHRGEVSKRRFLREEYGILEKYFYRINCGLRPPTQSLLLAIHRYHLRYFPQLPLRLLLTVSGIPAVVEFYVPPPRKPWPRFGD
jgi:hypothetical protein